MYKVESVEIEGFWHRFNARCDFNPEVNIIIGKNGTGKTTFMNILHAVLTADISELAENDFDMITIVLAKNGKKRTIKAQKVEFPDETFPIIKYKISRNSYTLRILNADERRVPLSIRKRLHERSLEIKKELNDLVSVASLSVYRLRNDDEYEVRDKYGTRVIVPPVDYRLSQAMLNLTQYQLRLSELAQRVAAKLQKEVLASILYSEQDLKNQGFLLSFDKDEEQEKLISAYKQLNSYDEDIRKKIKFHVNSIKDAIDDLSHQRQGRHGADIRPIEALRKTQKIIDLSLKAEAETTEIYSQVYLFLDTLKSFIKDKSFDFKSGHLIISNEHGEIDHSRLSSGEKQLLILLVEALLQNKEPHIFLADEPELSLHIDWQRKIIPAVIEINPNAQVIAATHSPEVASKFKESIFDMEEVISG